jgi:hypothetical protein
MFHVQKKQRTVRQKLEKIKKKMVELQDICATVWGGNTLIGGKGLEGGSAIHRAFHEAAAAAATWGAGICPGPCNLMPDPGATCSGDRSSSSRSSSSTCGVHYLRAMCVYNVQETKVNSNLLVYNCCTLAWRVQHEGPRNQTVLSKCYEL